MSYKWLITIYLSVITLSGCISTEQEMTQQSEVEIPANANKPEVATDKEQSLVELTPEQLRIKALYAQANLYQVHRIPLPPEQKALLLKTLAYLESENFEQGLATVQRAEQLGELNSSGYVIKADLLLHLSRAEEAETALKKALKINPYNPKAANRLATRYRERGEFTKALTLYTQAIEAVPVYPTSYRNRGVLQDLYLRDKAAALEDYQTYLALLNHLDPQAEDKPTQKTIKLVKIWLVDVQRQLQTLARQHAEN